MSTVMAASAVRVVARVTSGTADTVPADSEIGPGLVGFLATFAVVVVTVLLMLDLTRRIRRLRYRADAEAASERLRQAEQKVVDADGASSAHTGRSTDPPGRPAGQAVEPEASDEHDR